jgi:two-component system, NarL family, response regulator LiaR
MPSEQAAARKNYRKSRIATSSNPMDHQSSPLAVVPMKILIADDKLQVRRVLRGLIEGHQDWDVCAEAEDGIQAVNRAEQFRPDVIILDLAMPELNGFEAAARISKSLPDVPILMFTLYLSPEVEKEAAKVGVRRVISKSTGYQLVPAIEETFGQVHHEKTALQP